MKKIVTFVLALTLMIGVANAGTPYTYPGSPDTPGLLDNFDSLDGTWDHNNNSDQWDLSKISGDPRLTGGVETLVDPSDGATFLRIQDTGNPPFGDPDNRKIYFGHQVDFGLDGAHIEVRARIATGAPLDPINGNVATPWPAGGKGSSIVDDGKGMWGLAESNDDSALRQQISFSLALESELTEYSGYGGINTDVLLVNELNGNVPTSSSDTGEGLGPSYVPVNNATAWHTFVIDITAGGAGTHQVSIAVDGNPATVLDVTAGIKTEYDSLNSYFLTMGSSSTGAYTAFDIDDISAVPEPMTLSLLGLGGLALVRRRRK